MKTSMAVGAAILLIGGAGRIPEEELGDEDGTLMYSLGGHSLQPEVLVSQANDVDPVRSHREGRDSEVPVGVCGRARAASTKTLVPDTGRPSCSPKERGRESPAGVCWPRVSARPAL